MMGTDSFRSIFGNIHRNNEIQYTVYIYWWIFIFKLFSDINGYESSRGRENAIVHRELERWISSVHYYFKDEYPYILFQPLFLFFIIL